MKKITAILLSLVLAFSLIGCGNSQNNMETALTENTSMTELEEVTTEEVTTEEVTTEEVTTEEVTTEEVTTEESIPEEITPEKPESDSEGKTLVVYFSRSGNTEKIAQHVQERTGGDLYEIIPVNPYPENYEECTEVAEKEKDENARPEIADLPEDISEYSTILIGYPIWWHTAPMIIGTFLESYDLTDVDIHPFSQSGTMNEEQYAESLTFIETSAGNGIVHEGFFAEADDTDMIDVYLEANGLSSSIK